jgi:hypothetical protein
VKVLIEKVLEGMPPEQQRDHLNNKADDAIRKYGIKVKKSPEPAEGFNSAKHEGRPKIV